MSSPVGAAAFLLARRVRLLARALTLLAGVSAVAFLLPGGGVANGARDPRCSPPGFEFPSCPNLVPGRLIATVIDGGRALQIRDEVRNTGNTASRATTFQIKIGRAHV